jgi:hypothetical protein
MGNHWLIMVEAPNIVQLFSSAIFANAKITTLLNTV